MGSALAQVTAVLFASFAFIAGGGLFSSLTSLRGEVEGLSPTILGLAGSGYYGGFLVGCVVCPWFVRRSGHIRSLAAAAAVGGLVPLVMISFVHPVPWFLSRLVGGVSFAMLHAVVESWINDRAENRFRGRLMSVYVLVALVGNFVGQALLLLGDATDDRMFYLVVGLFIVSLVPVALTRSTNPSPPESIRLRPMKLWRRSPVAFVTALVNGLTSGAIWIIGPILLSRLHGAGTVGWVLPFYMVGGLITQWPLGRASDFVDRRYMLLLAALIATCGGVFSSVVSGWSPLWAAAGFLVVGMGGQSQYGIAVAHANDRSEPHESVEIASGILLVYGVGAMLGPILGSASLQFLGLNGLFQYLALMYGAWGVFTIVRILQRSPAVDTEEAAIFAVQHGPALGNLDLRLPMDVSPDSEAAEPFAPEPPPEGAEPAV